MLGTEGVLFLNYLHKYNLCRDEGYCYPIWLYEVVFAQTYFYTSSFYGIILKDCNMY